MQSLKRSSWTSWCDPCSRKSYDVILVIWPWENLPISYLVPTIVTSVSLLWSRETFWVNQTLTSFRQVCSWTNWSASSGFIDRYNWVSSAYQWHLMFCFLIYCNAFQRGIIHMLMSSGWTLWALPLLSLFTWPNWKWANMILANFWLDFVMLITSSSLLRRMLWLTVSNAALRSKTDRRVGPHC